jgi:hypothetical protein
MRCRECAACSRAGRSLQTKPPAAAMRMAAAAAAQGCTWVCFTPRATSLAWHCWPFRQKHPACRSVVGQRLCKASSWQHFWPCRGAGAAASSGWMNAAAAAPAAAADGVCATHTAGSELLTIVSCKQQQQQRWQQQQQQHSERILQKLIMQLPASQLLFSVMATDSNHQLHPSPHCPCQQATATRKY